MASHVYFLRNGTKKGCIKIGVADNISQRVRELQTGNPSTLTLVASIQFDTREQANKVEKYLHKKFRKHHVRGEWFKKDIKIMGISGIALQSDITVENEILDKDYKWGKISKIKRLEQKIRDLEIELKNKVDENEQLYSEINSHYAPVY